MAATGGATDPKGLSAEEMAIYDRQLRVWGVGAQTRLRAAHVVLVGVSMLAGEVAKNLVLAGVGHLSLLDDRAFDQASVRQHFLLRPTAPDLGGNRAERLALALRTLNPMVRVEGLPGPVPESLSQLLKEGDPGRSGNAGDAGEAACEGSRPQLVLIADAFPGAQVREWAETCRQAGVGFMLAEAPGRCAFYFQDLDGLQTERVTPALRPGDAETSHPVRLRCPGVAELMDLQWARWTATSAADPKLGFGRRLEAYRGHFWWTQWLLRARDVCGWTYPPVEPNEAELRTVSIHCVCVCVLVLCLT